MMMDVGQFVVTSKNVDHALTEVPGEILRLGSVIGSRDGSSVSEVIGSRIVIEDPLAREITVPSRRANLAAQIVETVWVLSGRDDIAAIAPYLPRARDFSDDGVSWHGAYGPRIRNWRGRVDQLEVAARRAAATGSRRSVISIYDAELDSDDSLKDIPCNNWIAFTNRNGVLDMSVSARSNDVIWGWSGINQFEWSVVQELIAALIGAEVGRAVYNQQSLHLYDRHWKRAAELTLDSSAIQAEFQTGPRIGDGWLEPTGGDPNLIRSSLRTFDHQLSCWWSAERVIRLGSDAIDVDRLAAEAGVRDAVLISWLHVLRSYWHGAQMPECLRGTRLEAALLVSVKPKRKAHVATASEPDISQASGKLQTDSAGLVDFTAKLQSEKSAVYKNSWRKRGELVGILGNIARKLDRLGAEGAGDTELDTRVDLLTYITLYLSWLDKGDLTPSQESHYVRHSLLRLQEGFLTHPEKMLDSTEDEEIFAKLEELFANVENVVRSGGSPRSAVCEMQSLSFQLALRQFWVDRATEKDKEDK